MTAKPRSTSYLPFDLTMWPPSAGFATIIEQRWVRKLPSDPALGYDMPAWLLRAGGTGWGFDLYTYGSLSGPGIPGIRLNAGSLNEIEITGDDANNNSFLSSNGGYGAMNARVTELRIGFADYGPFPGAMPTAWKNATGSSRLRGDVVQLAPPVDDSTSDFAYIALSGSGNDKFPKVVSFSGNGYGGGPPGDPTNWFYKSADKAPVRCSAGTYRVGDNLVTDTNYCAKVDNGETDPDKRLAVVKQYKVLTTAGLVYAEIR